MNLKTAIDRHQVMLINSKLVTIQFRLSPIE
jgi:hypothetical protein